METKLLNVINDCKEYLDGEAMDEIMHFYNHGEYDHVPKTEKSNENQGRLHL